MPGQKSRGSVIPPHHSQAQSSSGPAPKGAQAQGAHEDLIDFGQNDTPAPTTKTTDKTTNNTTDIEKILQATGSSNSQGGALIDFHEDLKKSLPPDVANKLKRQDTDTQSLDEFVDAQG